MISQKLSLTFWTLVTWFLKPVQNNSEAKRLYDDLMNGYNSLVRPVSNVSDKLLLKMGITLSQLIEVVSSLC